MRATVVDSPRVKRLTQRELEIADLVAQGMKTAEMSAEKGDHTKFRQASTQTDVYQAQCLNTSGDGGSTAKGSKLLKQ